MLLEYKESRYQDRYEGFLKIITVLSYQHSIFRWFFCFVLFFKADCYWQLQSSSDRIRRNIPAGMEIGCHIFILFFQCLLAVQWLTYRILKTNIYLWPVLLGAVLPSLCYHVVSSSAKIRTMKSTNWWKSLVLIIKNALSHIDS